MSWFTHWTIFIILYQTVFSIIMSWLILGCKLPPRETELHEVTLIKLLYLHDPEACGRVYFYNYTSCQPMASKIVWPVRNDLAAEFRTKISVWLSLHIIWTILSVVYVTLGQRSCGFYATLLPFTLAGVAILVMDLTYATMFLIDAKYTQTEDDILKYINGTSESVRFVEKTSYWLDGLQLTTSGLPSEQDTSWIALLLAYVSCRAVVQWLLNFWLIKDNFYEGLAYYQKMSQLQQGINNRRTKLSLF